MLVQETDLFYGLSREFISELVKIVVEEAFDLGVALFTEGEPANFFYILAEGKVRLLVGKNRDIEYTLSTPGASFGWSSLVGQGRYSARAQCAAPTRLFKINGGQLDRTLMKHPLSAMEFFKRLAGAMGDRLLVIYSAFPDYQGADKTASTEPGQITETPGR